MSLDVQRLSEALSTYADQLEVSDLDLQRRQGELRRRLDSSRHSGRNTSLKAAAAVVLLVALVVAGTLWWRRPDTTVPAAPLGAGQMTGLWSYVNQSWTTLLLVRPDGTFTEYSSTTPLVRHGAGDRGQRLTNDGQQILVDSTDPQGRPCRRTQSILAQSEGQVSVGPQTFDGAGCLERSGPAATITRLSPASPAGQNLPATTEGPARPVTDPVQLEGLWLLQGTSIVLAVDEIGGPAAYVIDSDGDLEPQPDAEGSLSAGPNGVLTLRSAGCAPTVLRRSEVHGHSAPQTLTTIVDSDPCNRFDGRETLTWIRIL